MLVLQANAAAIIIAIAVLALVLFLVLRKKSAPGPAAETPDLGKPTAAPVRSVASKETFAPLPPKPEAAPKVVERTPDADAGLTIAEPTKVEPAEDAKVAEVAPVEAPPVAIVEAPEPIATAGASKAADVEPAPKPAKTEPKAEAKPAKAEAKPAKTEPKAETKPAKTEPKPAKTEPKPATTEPKPAKADAKPAKPPKGAKAKDDVPWELQEDEPEEVIKVAEVEIPATMRDGLGRTRKEGFIAKLGSLFKRGKPIDDDLMDEVEEVLFTADIGARTADRLMSGVRAALGSKDMKDIDKVWSSLREEALAILSAPQPASIVAPTGPTVVMVLGVNGTGKTTTIGKLANRLHSEGKKVTLVAGDTFRAAAAEQLEHWGRRVGVDVYRGKENQDPASVVYDGVRHGLDSHSDYILVDTAGRLHNNTNLMEELKKVRRVMGRAIEGSPHEVLLVLDATTGQNAVVQARQFKDATEVTGIVLTKLDGTAKGGVVLGVADELKIPVRWVGVGERVADIRKFDAKEFVDELFQPPA